MGMGQQPTRGVSKLEAHRIFVDAHRPERSLVGRVGFGFAHLPRGVVGRRGHREHEGGFVVDPTHTGGEPQAHRLRGDERKRERKRLLVLVFLRRCILPNLVVLKLERELMVGDSLLEGEAPPENLARGGVGVEFLYYRTDEEVILLLSKLLTDIHRLVLKSSLVLFHRRSPHFRSVLWCPGSVIRHMRRNSSSLVAASDAHPSTESSWRGVTGVGPGLCEVLRIFLLGPPVNSGLGNLSSSYPSAARPRRRRRSGLYGRG